MKDTSKEIAKLQFEMMMAMSPNQRIAMACEMYMAARTAFLASLPEGLSEKDTKRRLYYRTYDEHLPDDFFDR
ncbi:MAG TPA: hypothetical protein VMM38_09865 [Aridibacter sp.]|nr:hypothetical protein [Aridibacter sp.]